MSDRQREGEGESRKTELDKCLYVRERDRHSANGIFIEPLKFFGLLQPQVRFVLCTHGTAYKDWDWDWDSVCMGYLLRPVRF